MTTTNEGETLVSKNKIDFQKVQKYECRRLFQLTVK